MKGSAIVVCSSSLPKVIINSTATPAMMNSSASRALPEKPRFDDPRAEKEDEKQRGHRRGDGAEGDVAEDVEDLQAAAELADIGQHARNPSPLRLWHRIFLSPVG